MKVEKQPAQEVELPGGEETEENLPLFPTPSDGCEAIVVIPEVSLVLSTIMTALAGGITTALGLPEGLVQIARRVKSRQMLYAYRRACGWRLHAGAKNYAGKL